MSLLKWALIFLVVSLIAALFGFGGIAAASADIARILSRKWNKPVTAVELPRLALTSILTGAKLPDFLIEALISLHEAAAAGEMAAASSDYEKLTGHKPESLESFLIRTA